ncbi:endonuclease/exonuclease/phosphatase family protein [Candidatus Liberibacter brunswickensis]|uniref:endonuclease/exonuclease/phosphatase family protein n=1 Tax=Candidatus Liberibacter brunswickensis TaxID=1968796 RepID=UPI002FE3AC36
MIRKYILVFVLFLIPYTSFAQRVRFVSWNINTLSEKEGASLWKNSVKREKSDYDLLRRYAYNLNADIISLQEMGSYNAVARIFPEDKWIIFYSGKNYFSNDSTHTTDNSDSSINTAIVVRKKENINVIEASYPLIKTNSHSRASKRKAVELLVTINGNRMWILNIHLKSFCFLNKLDNSHNHSCNLLNQQAQWIKTWINKKKKTGIPFVIAGDFNRKINQLGNNDDFWQKIDRDNSLIRFPIMKHSNCNANVKLSNKTPIDYFVMDENAYKILIKNSFHEEWYNSNDIKTKGNRLSDHCPIKIDYDF